MTFGSIPSFVVVSSSSEYNNKTRSVSSRFLFLISVFLVVVAVGIIAICTVANEDIDENDHIASNAIDHEIDTMLLPKEEEVEDNTTPEINNDTDVFPATKTNSSIDFVIANATTTTINTVPGNLNMVYFGNSLLYVNDCPGLIQKMILSTNVTTLQQDSCLQGGATFESLWEDSGCSLLTPFVLPGDNNDVSNDDEDGDDDDDDDDKELKIASLQGYHDWDYIIMQDQSQYPARQWTRHISKEAIQTKYAPLVQRTKDPKKRTIPIILQTAAYRSEGVQYSEDLGTFDNFTDGLMKGAKAYADTFNEVLFKARGDNIADKTLVDKFGARIAPVGEAYRWLRNNEPILYNKLYAGDEYHPSPYGTWLQACVVYIACLRTIPPIFDPNWMGGLSTEEASTLRYTACLLAGLDC